MTNPNANKMYPQAVNEGWMAAVYKNGKLENTTYTRAANGYLDWVEDPFDIEKASESDTVYCWVSPSGTIYVFGSYGDAVPMYLPTAKTKAKDAMMKTMVDLLSRAQMAFGRREWKVVTQVEVIDPVECQVCAYTNITKSVLKMLGVESTEKLGWQGAVKGIKGIWF